LCDPNWELLLHIHIDSSQIVVGMVLGQQEDKKSYAVYYVSNNLTSVELNYTITEKEFLAFIYAVINFGITSLRILLLYTLITQQSNI